jgi:hypothetical protein
VLDRARPLVEGELEHRVGPAETTRSSIRASLLAHICACSTPAEVSQESHAVTTAHDAGFADARFIANPPEVDTSEDKTLSEQGKAQSSLAWLARHAPIATRVETGTGSKELVSESVDGGELELISYTYIQVEVLDNFRSAWPERGRLRYMSVDGQTPQGDVVAFGIVADGDVALLDYLSVNEGMVAVGGLSMSVDELREALAQEEVIPLGDGE